MSFIRLVGLCRVELIRFLIFLFTLGADNCINQVPSKRHRNLASMIGNWSAGAALGVVRELAHAGAVPIECWGGGQWGIGEF